MKIENTILQILVNGITIYFVLGSFFNIDLLKLSQILILSIVIMNGYLINKKVLRENKCNINFKQIGVAVGMAIVNILILIIMKKIF